MKIHEKDIAVATVMNTILVAVGTGAALAYYLSISAYASTSGFLVFSAGYLCFLISIYVYYTKRRYQNVG